MEFFICDPNFSYFELFEGVFSHQKSRLLSDFLGENKAKIIWRDKWG